MVHEGLHVGWAGRAVRLMALTVFVAGSPAVVAAQAAASQTDEVSYEGSFVLTIEAPRTQVLEAFAADIRGSGIFQTTVAELNETIALPRDLGIFFTECGAVNAFFDPANTRILMCYELVAYFAQQFQGRYEDAAAADAAVADATMFIFQHELGHALVELLELPITGKEEDAVDDLATLVLLHEWEGGDESALNAAEAFYAIGEVEEAEATAAAEGGEEMLPYYDEHSLGKQRYYQVVCIVYGSDPEAHADLVGEDLPEERAVRCPAEYQQKANSWDVLLADYYLAADDAVSEDNEEASPDEEGDGEDIDGGDSAS